MFIQDNIPHFYSNDYKWTRITNRGFIKTFDPDQIPEGMWDPGRLTGTYCRIDNDGKLYKIIGVEKFQHMISPEDPYDKPFSLMVKNPLISMPVTKQVYLSYGNLEYLANELLEFMSELPSDQRLIKAQYRLTEDQNLLLEGQRWLTQDELDSYSKGLFDE